MHGQGVLSRVRQPPRRPQRFTVKRHVVTDRIYESRFPSRPPVLGHFTQAISPARHPTRFLLRTSVDAQVIRIALHPLAEGTMKWYRRLILWRGVVNCLAWLTVSQ